MIPAIGITSEITNKIKNRSTHETRSEYIIGKMNPDQINKLNSREQGKKVKRMHIFVILI